MEYIQSPSLLGHLIRLPDNFQAESSYPLIIGLHGGGGSAEGFISIWNGLDERDFIFAAPHGPYPAFEDQDPSYDWAMWPSGNEELIAIATELSVEYIVNVTKNICDLYDIGDVYLMGFSQGAYLSYLAGMRNHDVFSGIICLSGPGLLEPLNNPFGNPIAPDWVRTEEIRAARHLRVFIAHGEYDEGPKYEWATQSRDILLENEYDVTFRGFEGKHEYPPTDILAHISRWVRNS